MVGGFNKTRAFLWITSNQITFSLIYKDEYETPKNKNTFNSILFNIVMYRNKLKKNNWLLFIYYILKGYDLFFWSFVICYYFFRNISEWNIWGIKCKYKSKPLQNNFKPINTSINGMDEFGKKEVTKERAFTRKYLV